MSSAEIFIGSRNPSPLSAEGILCILEQWCPPLSAELVHECIAFVPGPFCYSSRLESIFFVIDDIVRMRLILTIYHIETCGTEGLAVRPELLCASRRQEANVRSTSQARLYSFNSFLNKIQNKWRLLFRLVVAVVVVVVAAAAVRERFELSLESVPDGGGAE